MGPNPQRAVLMKRVWNPGSVNNVRIKLTVQHFNTQRPWHLDTLPGVEVVVFLRSVKGKVEADGREEQSLDKNPNTRIES